jgi:hypothetical protein
MSEALGKRDQGADQPTSALLTAATKIKMVRSRISSTASDGGSSGRSDTNDTSGPLA